MLHHKTPFLPIKPLEFFKAPKIETVTNVIELPHAASLDDFNATPDFFADYPTFFKLGFPKPITISGSGTAIGDVRNIQFESSTKGIGTLSLKVIASSDSSIVFKPISDDSHIGHWLSWKEIKVELVESGPNQTTIRLLLHTPVFE